MVWVILLLHPEQRHQQWSADWTFQQLFLSQSLRGMDAQWSRSIIATSSQAIQHWTWRPALGALTQPYFFILFCSLLCLVCCDFYLFLLDCMLPSLQTPYLHYKFIFHCLIYLFSKYLLIVLCLLGTVDMKINEMQSHENIC